MPSLRYIHISLKGTIDTVDVVTQLHYLLTPGEVPNPDAKFWDLTIGGTLIKTGDGSHDLHLLTCQQVSNLADALRKESWENLERVAENNHDMMPGWHHGLRPEFEKLRDFMAHASKDGDAVLRVSFSDGFWYR